MEEIPQMPVISVIVPIYNVEQYLARCIDSIINQTYKNLEIILVDDGSPDQCGIICDEYARKDKRIKVIHKENGGLSDARNVGMNLATGKYIAFLDSDDYILSNAYELLLKEMEENDLDIVIGNGVYVLNQNPDNIRGTIFKIRNFNEIVSGYDYLYFQHKNKDYEGYVYTKLYKKDFLVENKFYFEPGAVFEDYSWTNTVFLKAGRVKYMDHLFYYYCLREDSISGANDINLHIRFMKVGYDLMLFFDKLKNKKHRKVFAQKIIKIYLRGYCFVWKNKKNRHLLKKDRFLLLKLASDIPAYIVAIFFATTPPIVHVNIFIFLHKLKNIIFKA